MELHSRKKTKQDRIRLSNSFKTKEVREKGRKEKGESKNFPVSWMAIIDKDFQIEEKKCKDQER